MDTTARRGFGPWGRWDERTRRWRSAVLTLLLLNCLLLVPVWIVQRRLGPHWLSLEAVLVVGAFLALPRTRWARWAAGFVAAAAVAFLILGLGDATARLSLARPLNLYLDVRLVGAVSNLLSGNLGAGWGPLVLVGGAASAGGVGVLLARLLRALAPVEAEGTGAADDSTAAGGSGRAALRSNRLGGVAVLAVALLLIPLRWVHPSGVVLALPATQLVREQSTHLARMLREQDRFALEMAAAPSTYEQIPGLLRGLGGRDVIMAFIESYGISALEDPRYGPVVRPRLEAMESELSEAGLHMATGLLVAPSQGGMSWLGHGSVLSGLWLDNQLRYDLLMASNRHTLVDDFRSAGYRTVALMPAITMAWPEGTRLGYDEVFAFQDIDYAGPPLNWVTMPDQFTWSFLENTIRTPDADRPVFAELGLISSHAPWTPILEVLPEWDGIGDGAVFERWRDAGLPPEELWKDVDGVRAAYAESVAYSVEVLGSYARRYLDEGTLLVAMGDHQPAPLITGEEASRAVPIHVLAADRSLLEPFLRWGFVEGALPPAESSPRRMDAFRDWFVGAFSGASTRHAQ